MEEAMAARYWCYLCSQMVNPIMEVEIKCPFCQSGFVEEMTSSTSDVQDSDFSSDRALSLWAPILLGMMGNPRRRRRLRRLDFEEDDVNNDDGHRGEIDIDRELESFMRRRRRSSVAILHLLQGIRAGMASEAESSEGDRDRNADRERVILINPLNNTIITQGSYDSSSQNRAPVGSLGDYFIGPGLDLLLQHLAENDPNRYGTPPAQKEAIKALPTVTIKDTSQCSICLDDFEIGIEAKEMPCRHRFHDACIFPWLELHSSCPVCRYQLPADQSKSDSERSQNDGSQRGGDDSVISTSSNINNDDNDNGGNIEEGEVGGRNGNGNGRRFSFLWRLNSLFSSGSGSGSGSGAQSSGSNSSSLSNASGSSAHANEN